MSIPVSLLTRFRIRVDVKKCAPLSTGTDNAVLKNDNEPGSSPTTTTTTAKTTKPKAFVSRAIAQRVVQDIATKHGLRTLTFPSLAVKFRPDELNANNNIYKPRPLSRQIVADAMVAANTPIISNPNLNRIKSTKDLVSALSATNFAAPKSLLAQSYDVFNNVDTVKAYFHQMDVEGTRPPNLFLRPTAKTSSQ
ncbi:hypothetical protein HK100_004555 [Physocladia obscura]|uniref:Uncharacterized protein n=1 Tax=Physocladia obscura TaxID=109957 RepID=A0AAD5SSY0_9FUNG|nr:hypothetical protein HK100_004555 [Physocladia obscura]